MVACGGSSRSADTITTAEPSASTPATRPTESTPAETTPTTTTPEITSTLSSPGAPGLPGAVATLDSKGYYAAATDTYRTDTTLRVLIGVFKGSAASRAQQAFFFSGDNYLGTDTSEPSAGIQVVGQDDTQVTLRYTLFRKGEPLCCPTGGHTDVRFRLDNGKLQPLDAIPSASPLHDLNRQ